MGISRDSMHKRSHTGAKRAQMRKKRKFELGRQPANTRIGPKKIHILRARGGNKKYRALRLESGNFSWRSESCTKKVRITNVVYNATSNELVRTNTLVKGAIVEVEFYPFRSWYESHYNVAYPVTRKTTASSEKGGAPNTFVEKKVHGRREKKHKALQQFKDIDPAFVEMTSSMRAYARLTSRPGQSGRADGYLLEGKELDFYVRRLRSKK